MSRTDLLSSHDLCTGCGDSTQNISPPHLNQSHEGGSQMSMQIRDATKADLDGILSIYNDAVLHTTAVWNATPVDRSNRLRWMTCLLYTSPSPRD